ncbi:hypothetical protein ACTOB_007825 [Actinoplanes oblitus]|uniref:Histidine kinase n=1 Tax=Actinoplanes oblitus TaxID=3040509 RepID=A0ABY8WGS3_9ACTN|nr:hypothetical protein [Actinoplanes oblitus]WIM95698.1 hypothetical protein ACTOB_007825 [Actinoplanes oblitus]
MTTAAPSLDWGVRLLYLQSVGLAALTVYLVVLDLTSAGADIGVAASLTVLAALAAVVVFLVARSLGRRKVRARGPAVVVQLFALATGGFLVQVGPLWLGVALLVLAAVTALLVLLPASGRALGLD